MKKVKLMAHLIAGYPNKAGFKETVHGLKDGGADILELQIPFSDPTADGPIITQACEQTILNKFQVKEIFNYIKDAQLAGFKEIIVMTYANIAFNYGIQKFVKDLKSAGISGIIIPDLPLEDEEGFYTYALKEKINPIPVVAINLLPERFKLLKPFGKVYVSLRTGTTGSKTEITPETKKFLKKLKGLEIMAGFGLQSKNQIKALAPYIDIAIAGSYFSKTIALAVNNKKNIYTEVFKSITSLK